MTRVWQWKNSITGLKMLPLTANYCQYLDLEVLLGDVSWVWFPLGTNLVAIGKLDGSHRHVSWEKSIQRSRNYSVLRRWLRIIRLLSNLLIHWLLLLPRSLRQAQLRKVRRPCANWLNKTSTGHAKNSTISESKALKMPWLLYYFSGEKRTLRFSTSKEWMRSSPWFW